MISKSPNHKSMCNLFLRISCSPQNREFARINFADLVATVRPQNEYARNLFPGYQYCDVVSYHSPTAQDQDSPDNFIEVHLWTPKMDKIRYGTYCKCICTSPSRGGGDHSRIFDP